MLSYTFLFLFFLLTTTSQGVFTELIEKLGVKGLEFTELLSIDPESLKQVKPLYGLIFLFKYRASEIQQRKIRQESAGAGAVFGPSDGHFDEVSATLPSLEYPEQSVFFAHQKIQNACATQAVLSLLLNLHQGSNKSIEIGEILTNFSQFVDSFDPELRGETISNSEEIRAVHNSFSRPNPFVEEDDPRREHDENDDGIYHFISYCPINGKLYELDGLQAFPIIHSDNCTLDNFPNKVSEVLQQRIANSPEGEMRFALLGLTSDPRIELRAIGDTDGLEREQAKRAEWREENILRRENFIGLIHSLVKSVSKSMTDEEWEQTIIEPGRKAATKRVQQVRERQMHKMH